MSDEEKHEWDRITGESSKAYAHFCLYRDMGVSRSLRTLEKADGCTSDYRQLGRWSSKWQWVERSRRYDDYLEAHERLRQEKERRDMRKRHAQIALLGQNIAVKALESLLQKVQAGTGEVAPGDVTRLLDTSVKVERLARGESTETHELTGPGGGPVRLGIAETLERIDEIYGLKKRESGAQETRNSGEKPGPTQA